MLRELELPNMDEYAKEERKRHNEIMKLNRKRNKLRKEGLSAEEIEKRLKQKTKYQTRPINAKLKLSVKERDNFKCVECGNSDIELHVHHKIHRKDGGRDEIDNLITLCVECHTKQHEGENVHALMSKRKQRL